MDMPAEARGAGRGGRGRGRGRRSRRRDDEDDQSGVMTMEEWEARNAAPKIPVQVRNPMMQHLSGGRA